MAHEEPWECLKYSYGVDPRMPGFIGKKTPIFDITADDVNMAPHHNVKADIMYGHSKETTAQQISGSMGVEGSYGAFSGAASMSFSHGQSSEVETVRIDTTVRATKWQCIAQTSLKLNPETKLNPDALNWIHSAKVEDITEQLGEFVATGCFLGGLFQKSYVMEVAQSDTRESLSTELEAQYGKGFLSVTASASGAIAKRSGNKNAKITTSWHAEGGKTTLWLNAGMDNIDEIKAAWSASIVDANLFPFQFALVPIWQVVKKVDPDKGAALEHYLKQKWESNIPVAPSRYADEAVLPGFPLTGWVENHADGWNKAANGLIQKLNSKGVKTCQVVSITAYNNKPEGDAFFAAFYSTHIEGGDVCSPSTMGYHPQNSAEYGWSKFNDNSKAKVSDVSKLISITNCCNANNSGVSYVWYRK